ncbi:hypothetical protein TWF217_012040 [Orbilia oligospora]|nr:hypothetical protein TWF217_012040 [Orbilia oligospora]
MVCSGVCSNPTFPPSSKFVTQPTYTRPPAFSSLDPKSERAELHPSLTNACLALESGSTLSSPLFSSPHDFGWLLLLETFARVSLQDNFTTHRRRVRGREKML